MTSTTYQVCIECKNCITQKLNAEKRFPETEDHNEEEKIVEK